MHSSSYWEESFPSAASRDTHLSSHLPQISQPHLPSPNFLLSPFLYFSLSTLSPPDDTGLTQVMGFLFLCWSHWIPYLNPTFRLDVSMEYDLFISRYYRVWDVGTQEKRPLFCWAHSPLWCSGEIAFAYNLTCNNSTDDQANTSFYVFVC